MIGEKGADLIRGLEPLEPAVFDGNDRHPDDAEPAPPARVPLHDMRSSLKPPPGGKGKFPGKPNF